jgi:hypothetical protein
MIEIKSACRNCGHQFSGMFCNRCGEKRYNVHDRSLLHFFEEGFHFITHLEGTLFTTLSAMLRTPGKLSDDYCNGIRKKYFKPLSLFLLLVVLYLIFPVFEGLNMRMHYHKGQDLYGAFAEQVIQQKMASTGLTEAVLAEKFHAKGEKVSKFLLLSIIPFTALYLYVFSFFRRRYFFDQMVLAAEINAAYLLWGFLLLPLLTMMISASAEWITGRPFYIHDELLGILIYVVICTYVFRAALRFYRFRWWQSLLFTALFFLGHTFIVYSLYKFLLFVTVIYQIH